MIHVAGRDFADDTEVVDLVNVRPTNLEPLGGLTSLRVLRIRHTNPHRTPGGLPVDLRALASCPALEIVEVPRLALDGLEGLGGHQHLQRLDVSSTRVDDLGPLVDLPALAELRVRHTGVVDLAPLAGLVALAHLDVAHTPVADLAPLADVTGLVDLDLRATPVTDLSPLHGLPQLRRVVVQRLELAAGALDDLRAARPGVEVAT